MVLGDLQQAWESITMIGFTVESLETSTPQLFQVLDPGKALVVPGIEARIGEAIQAAVPGTGWQPAGPHVMARGSPMPRT